MKLKKGINLESYGFFLANEFNYMDLSGKFCYRLGTSKEGQDYYYVVGEDMELKIFASNYSKYNGSIIMDGVVFKMFADGCFE